MRGTCYLQLSPSGRSPTHATTINGTVFGAAVRASFQCTMITTGWQQCAPSSDCVLHGTLHRQPSPHTPRNTCPPTAPKPVPHHSHHRSSILTPHTHHGRRLLAGERVRAGQCTRSPTRGRTSDHCGSTHNTRTRTRTYTSTGTGTSTCTCTTLRYTLLGVHCTDLGSAATGIERAWPTGRGAGLVGWHHPLAA